MLLINLFQFDFFPAYLDYEINPKNDNEYRTHTPTYYPLAMQGKQIVWRTTNYVTGIPDKNVMRPYHPKLKSATQRFTNF